MYRSPRDCIDVFSRDGIDVFLYLLTRSTRQLPTSSPLMKWKGEQIFICFLSFVNHIMYESFEISSPRRQTVARHLEAGAQIESKGKIFLMTILVFAGILKIYIYIYIYNTSKEYPCDQWWCVACETIHWPGYVPIARRYSISSTICYTGLEDRRFSSQFR